MRDRVRSGPFYTGPLRAVKPLECKGVPSQPESQPAPSQANTDLQRPSQALDVPTYGVQVEIASVLEPSHAAESQLGALSDALLA